MSESPHDFLISYGYRHILKETERRPYKDRALNLHISLLPWNRGADPNFWSFFDDTPKGVSIHHLDQGVDTGDLIAQREYVFGENETLATSYAKLQTEIQKLFWSEVWPAMERGTLPRIPQKAGGSIHKKKDLESHRDLLKARGWDTPVKFVVEAGRHHRQQS